ncbi:hypothetical protein QJS10_CPB21g00871 [Acorus calamus]|uniref:Uncharacterized protein n=1 Tax=Acorus calamus TaxID=4465 RepID=A0AAV9C1U0_ACOCL|nr:hypothetical protein QJS10_CPB21g00871 [Acorus calamus]
MAESPKIASKKKPKYVNLMGDEVNHQCYMKYLRDILGKEKVALITGLPFHGKALDVKNYLKRFSERIRQRDAEKEGVPLGYVGGCTVAVWFYEHTRLRRLSAYGKVPRMFRWGRLDDKGFLIRCLEKFYLLTEEEIMFM